MDSLAWRIVVPLALIGALIVAGFIAAKRKGRSAAPADTLALMTEGMSPSDALADRWANARTIAVHVEEIEPLED